MKQDLKDLVNCRRILQGVAAGLSSPEWVESLERLILKARPVGEGASTNLVLRECSSAICAGISGQLSGRAHKSVRTAAASARIVRDHFLPNAKAEAPPRQENQTNTEK